MTLVAQIPLLGAGGEPVDFARTIVSHGVAELPPNRVDLAGRTLETTLPVPRGARTVRIRANRARLHIEVNALFEVPGDQLMTAPFSELLAGSIGDADRFERVEAKIAKAQRPLKAVKAGEVPDFPWLMSPDEIAAQRKRSESASKPKRKARR
jgi:hypothetical protein